MECGSSSSTTFSPTLEGTYDVFLSFGGEDIRKGFVSHLYQALMDRGIQTFRGDERLEKGISMAQEIFNAIDNSKISIVVFSESYVNSSRCLDELVRIVESRKRKLLLPVFYYVDPSDIRKQKNAVKKALAECGVESPEKMKNWREALTKAAEFSGLDVPKTANGDEAACIQEIVDSVVKEVSRRIRYARKDLVGMDWRANKVLRMVRQEDFNIVRFIGIFGLKGSGKTTIASAVFDELKDSYDSSCFLQIDCAEKFSDNLLKHLQEALIYQLLNLKLEISHKERGIDLIKSMLPFKKKVLIVVDNVYDEDQLEALAMEKDSFGEGSRVIMTTRDPRMLKKADETYSIDLLDENEAIQLFRQHTFKNNHPNQSFEELSEKVVPYARGVPLALKQLGSDLCGMSLEDWSSVISCLQRHTYKKLDWILKTSDDILNEE